MQVTKGINGPKYLSGGKASVLVIDDKSYQTARLLRLLRMLS